MAWKLADLFVQISGDSKPLASSLALVKAQLLGMAGMGAVAGAGFTKGLASSLLGLGAASGPGAVVTMAVAAGASLVKLTLLAGDLSESVNKMEQAFGSASHTVLKFADEAASKYGLVRETTLDAASSFGFLLQSAGVATDQAAELSIRLTKLAADSTSLFNTDFQSSVMKLRSALAGEALPLREYGVLITEGMVAAKAFAMGLKEPNRELSEGAKVLARLALAEENLGKANGDLDRTSGSLSNQWRQLGGNVYNLGEGIAKDFIPALTLTLKAINGMIFGLDWVNRKFQEYRNWIGEITGLTDIFQKTFKAITGTDFFSEETSDKALAAIDARNAKLAEGSIADQAVAGAMHGKQAKGFQGGMEDYVKKVQEAAFGNGKDATAKATLAEAQKQTALLQKVAEGLIKKPVNAAIAVAF